MEPRESIPGHGDGDSAGRGGHDRVGQHPGEASASPLILKLEELRRQIVADRGEFALFAVFLRENAPDTWDLVASAPWINSEGIESYKLFYMYLSKVLSTEEFQSVSRVVVLDTADPHVRDFCEQYAGVDQLTPIHNFSFGIVRIQTGYVLSANLTVSLEGKRIRKIRPQVGS